MALIMFHEITLLRLLSLLFILLQTSCLQFNQCQSNSGIIIGQLAIDLDLRKSTIRTQEAPVGNLVTDSLMFNAMNICKKSKIPCPRLAFINSGSLRSQSSCGEKDQIKSGLIYKQDISELLPFENSTVIVSLTGKDIRLALERSVSKLEQGGVSSGHFLQVAGLSFDISCEGESQRIISEGTNSQILLEGTRVSNIQVVDLMGQKEALKDSSDYEVLTSKYIAQGGDGFLSFLIRDQNHKVIFDDNGEALPKMNFEQDRLQNSDGIQITAQNAMIAFIESEYQQKRSVGRPIEGRININNNCFTNTFQQ